MISPKFSTTADTIREKHPGLYSAITNLIKTDPVKYANLKANFSGRYAGRMVSYGKLFDALEQAGFKIQIIVN